MSHAVKKVGHVISKGWHKLTHGVEHLGKEISRHKDWLLPLAGVGALVGTGGLGLTGTQLMAGINTAAEITTGLSLAKSLTAKVPEMPEMPAQPPAPRPVGTIDTRTLLGSGIEDLVKPTKTRYSSLYGLGVAKELG